MTRRLSVALYLSALALLGLSLYINFTSADFGDRFWEMLYAHTWLSGKALYRDLLPVNPPLIFWIYALPATLAEHLSALRDMQWLVALCLMLVAISIFLCTQLIALHPGFDGKRRLDFAILLAFMLICQVRPMFFADREHLFLVLTLPYMTRFMPSLARLRPPLHLSLAIGLLAGIGFCIKPYCFIVFAGLQLICLWRERSARILISPENVIIYAVSLLYAFILLRWYPEYISVVLPMASASYSATRSSVPVAWHLLRPLTLFYLSFICLRLKENSPYRRDLWYWAMLCLFLLLYALAGNDWEYTYVPLVSVCLLVVGFSYWEFRFLRGKAAPSSEGARRATLGARLCLMAIAFIAVLYGWYLGSVPFDPCHFNMRCGNDDKTAAEVTTGGKPLSFGTITMDFTRWTRLSYYTKAPWESRFPQLWMLPKFLEADERFISANHWILDYVADALASDMERRKPDVLFVDNDNVFYTVHREVDLVRYFSFNPRFTAAFGHYRYVHTLDACGSPQVQYTTYKINCSYRVYRRLKE
jgi:hypothetical protein